MIDILLYNCLTTLEDSAATRRLLLSSEAPIATSTRDDTTLGGSRILGHTDWMLGRRLLKPELESVLIMVEDESLESPKYFVILPVFETHARSRQT
jgi:hypothetical protein